MTTTTETTTTTLELKPRQRGFEALAWLADNVSQDPNRHVLNRILVDPLEEAMIATDGRKLAKAPISDALPADWIANGPILLAVAKKTKTKLVLQRDPATNANLFPKWKEIFPGTGKVDAGQIDYEVSHLVKHQDGKSRLHWQTLWTLLFRHQRMFFDWQYVDDLRFPPGPSELVTIRISETEYGLGPAWIKGENGFEALLMPIRGIEE